MDSRIMDLLADRVLELGPKPAADSPYRNFKLTRDEDGIAWLLFDRADTSANSIRGQIYNADGTTVGSEFVINTITAMLVHPPEGGFKSLPLPFIIGCLMAASGAFLVAKYAPSNTGGAAHKPAAAAKPH
jgi:hypothetical protein